MNAAPLPLEPPLSPGASPFPTSSTSSSVEPHPPEPEPAGPPVDLPAPPLALQPEPQPQPPVAPPPAARAHHAVVVRLTTGELVEVAAHADPAAAAAEATALMRYLRDGRGDWPFIAGRFVRPDAIVSIDLAS